MIGFYIQALTRPKTVVAGRPTYAKYVSVCFTDVAGPLTGSCDGGIAFK